MDGDSVILDIVFQSDIERAEELISSGQQLLHSRHYCALDCVQPKCSELQRICQLLSERLESRLNTLAKCRDLQERIDKVPESGSFIHYRNFTVTKNDFHNLFSWDLMLLGWSPNRLVWQYCTELVFRKCPVQIFGWIHPSGSPGRCWNSTLKMGYQH
jgi:hypothetical protein